MKASARLRSSETALARAAALASTALLFAVCAFAACAPASPRATSARAAPLVALERSPELAAWLERAAAEWSGEVELRYAATATLQRQIENELTRVQGRVALRARDGALVAARIEADVREPGRAEPRHVDVVLAESTWVALDALARTRTKSPDRAGLGEPARAALALLPERIAAPRTWIERDALARLGDDTALGGAACTNVEWTSADRRASGQWLVARSDGVPRFATETRDTPGVEIEVRRVTLQDVQRTQRATTDAPPGASAAERAAADRGAGTPRLELAAPQLQDGWTELTSSAPRVVETAPNAAAPLELDAALEPLRARFDAAAGVPRVIGVYAPSCLNCLRLARSTKRALLDAHPDARFELYAVWVDVLDGDTPAAARDAAQYLDDPRVLQFHDRERRFARLLAPHVGMPALRDLLDDWHSTAEEQDAVFVRDFVEGPACAYDWIVFYAPSARWIERDLLPTPSAAVVQMDPQTWLGIDARRFFWGAAMRAELERLAGVHLSAAR